MKRKRTLSLILAGTLLFSCAGCVRQHPEDQEEDKKVLASDYRIAATSVATCEILDALGVESEHVVGIPHSDTYTVPAIYENAKSLGSPMAPDMEILKSLEVDYVLTPNSLEGELKPQYDNIGVKSYFLDLKSVDGMYASIRELGELLDKNEQAERLCEEYERFKAELSERNGSEDPPKVLILMGLPGSYVVATESSYVGSLVKLAGAENIYGDGDGSDFLYVNVEDMLSRNPDIIFRTSHAMPEQVKVMFAEEFENNDIWKHFDAVKNGKVYDLDHTNCGMSATFRYKEAISDITSFLYGEQP
ncbi:MAG: heme ABC transporter substrate-binding protein IsdE [Lachnospiraceae bacterium]|nr:heme ABC transporter substrate-binding protein IsdE [Lachnospiraceae bacterium]